MGTAIHRVLGVAVFLFTFVGSASAVQLSPRAQVYLVTCGPGQNELYSAFGHSAVRVYDPGLNMDLVFNYGVFDFDQPNFYLNFAKGNLLYQLAVNDYQRFTYSYIVEGRSIFLQELNLDSAQRQAVFNFLEWNARLENKDYYYDYFYDNCATRPRTALEQSLAALGQHIEWKLDYAKPDYSIRDLCEDYLYYQPWGDLGIDLCLGLPMDKKATALEYTFLPDYMAKATSGASIVSSNGTKPLVKSSSFVAEQTYVVERPWFTPAVCFSLLLLVGILMSALEHTRGISFIWFDRALFSLIGLVGWLLLCLWLFTDHQAAARNMNLLWAIPFYFPTMLFLTKKGNGFTLFVMRFSFVIQIICLAGWFFWPQDLHPGIMGLSALLLWRSFWRVYVANRKSTSNPIV
jgi:hypothetical protein